MSIKLDLNVNWCAKPDCELKIVHSRGNFLKVGAAV